MTALLLTFIPTVNVRWTVKIKHLGLGHLKSISQAEHLAYSCHLLSHEENTEIGKILIIT